MVPRERKHFLAWFSMPFHVVVWSILLRAQEAPNGNFSKTDQQLIFWWFLILTLATKQPEIPCNKCFLFWVTILLRSLGPFERCGQPWTLDKHRKTALVKWPHLMSEDSLALSCRWQSVLSLFLPGERPQPSACSYCSCPSQPLVRETWTLRSCLMPQPQRMVRLWGWKTRGESLHRIRCLQILLPAHWWQKHFGQ